MEVLSAAQACDLRAPLLAGTASRAAIASLRRVVPTLVHDRVRSSRRRRDDRTPPLRRADHSGGGGDRTARVSPAGARRRASPERQGKSPPRGGQSSCKNRGKLRHDGCRQTWIPLVYQGTSLDVMDGNGRWGAPKRGLPATEGHAAGEEGAVRTRWRERWSSESTWMTMFAFSTENWRRPPDEVRYLMHFQRAASSPAIATI